MQLPRRIGHGQGAALVDHLGELRVRLTISLAALAAGFGVGYAFHGRVLGWLNGPLPPEHHRPVTFGVTEPFMTSMKVSLAVAFALALPVILWQLWSFLAPAFMAHTQRTIARLVVAAAALFVGGVVFAYRVALPAAVHFLTTYDSHLYNIQVRASLYYSFALMTLVAVGVVFELPVFVLALVRLGVTSSKRLRRSRRVGYVAMAALAVALPGVDPVTTAFEMVPLILLYEASIWLSVIFEPRWQTQKTAAAAGT